MNKFFTLFSLVALLSMKGYAQENLGSVSGNVTSSNKGVEAATVSLLNGIDSSLVKMTVSAKTGAFQLNNISQGKYLVSISAVGYSVYYSPAFEITNTKASYDLQTIELVKQEKALAGVVVTAKRPMIEQRLDKTIVNVDASPTNTGLTALEVLEKSPGIAVDKDGNISLKGKPGVMVMLDGKPTYLSAQDLANMLKNMPSSQVEQIEIMSNPPAKYDAAGNSGIINIKTKKNKTQGFNGNVSVGAGYGFEPKSNNSLQLNYRKGKMNIFANYSFNYRKDRQFLNINRRFTDTIFSQVSRFTPDFTTQNLKVGADFFASKKTTLGVVITGYDQQGVFRNDNTTLIKDKAGNLATRTVTDIRNDEHWKNTTINFNLRHVIDSTGKELTADIDYLRYGSRSLQSFKSYFYDNLGSKKHEDEILKGDLPSDIHVYTAKIDYTHPVTKDAKIEAGLKTSLVETDNNAQYAMLANNAWVVDQGRSNHFIYNENIYAAYINGNTKINSKWSAQLGLRVEHTNAKGRQLASTGSFDRNYTSAFPTAFISYELNKKNQFGLSYGRRIDRPSYQDMNPFYFFIDKYTYQVGNPYLRPQISNKIELNHSFNSKINSSISYSTTDDVMQTMFQQIDSLNVTYVMEGNIAKLRNLSLSVSANIPVTKWWRANIYTNVYHNQYRGNVSGGVIDFDGTSFMGNVSNQFTINKTWSAELSGFYRSRSNEGTIWTNPMGAVNIGVSKQVLKGKGTIRMNVRDIFFTQVFSGYSKYGNIDVDLSQSRDSRVVNLTFTYRFGKPLQNTPQRKRGGSGDEQNRIKMGSN